MCFGKIVRFSTHIPYYRYKFSIINQNTHILLNDSATANITIQIKNIAARAAIKSRIEDLLLLFMNLNGYKKYANKNVGKKQKENVINIADKTEYRLNSQLSLLSPNLTA